MAEPTTTVTPPGGKPAKVKRRGGNGARLLNLFLLIVIIAVIALFVRSEMKNRQATSQLQKTQQELETIRKSTSASGDEVAKQVLEKVRKHIEVPDQPAPTVATIVDVDKLKQANDFYKNAKNGDNLIITAQRAILYDPDKDIIIDVVPVVITSPSPTPVGQTPAPTPAGGAAGTVPPAAPVNNSPAPAAGSSTTTNNAPVGQ